MRTHKALIGFVFICYIVLYSQNVVLAEDRLNHLTVTHGVWVDSDLPDMPGNIVSGNLEFVESYYLGLTYARTLVNGFTIPIPFTEIRMKGWDLELEGSVLKHYNIQDHWEVTCALVLRTRKFIPLSFLGWTFAGGWGLSYALEEPSLEKGPDGIPGEDSVQLQSHIVIEADFFYPEFDRLHLVARIHHRSGIYGVISPQKTGSNFLAAGIRFDF
jgi:hypothetical protein